MTGINPAWGAGETTRKRNKQKAGSTIRDDVRLPDDPTFPDKWAALTQRQRETMRCRALGLTQRECAEKLGLSEQTVKNHITRVLRVFGQGAVVGRISYLLGRYESVLDGSAEHAPSAQNLAPVSDVAA